MIGLWYIINLGGWVLKKALLAIIFALLFINYSLGSEAMKVEAPFKEGQDIPRKYTCDGEDVSPQVKWSGQPSNTKSFVLIMDDPDAPVGTFTHWIVYDIPASQTSLQENFPKRSEVRSIKQGINDFGRVGYGGPCPPRGHTHKYYIKVYALDVESLGLRPGATRREVESKMQGHVIGQGQTMGRYGRR